MKKMSLMLAEKSYPEDLNHILHFVNFLFHHFISKVTFFTWIEIIGINNTFKSCIRKLQTHTQLALCEINLNHRTVHA